MLIKQVGAGLQLAGFARPGQQFQALLPQQRQKSGDGVARRHRYRTLLQDDRTEPAHFPGGDPPGTLVPTSLAPPRKILAEQFFDLVSLQPGRHGDLVFVVTFAAQVDSDQPVCIMDRGVRSQAGATAVAEQVVVAGLGAALADAIGKCRRQKKADGGCVRRRFCTGTGALAPEATGARNGSGADLAALQQFEPLQ